MSKTYKNACINEFDRSALSFEQALSKIVSTVHCSKKFANNKILSKNFDITQDNVDKMMNFRLFKYENYCKGCMEYVNPKGHFPVSKYGSVLSE